MSVGTLFLIAVALLIMELVVVSMGALGFLAFCAFIYGLYIMHDTGMTELYGVHFDVIAGIGTSIFVMFAIGGYFALKAFGRKIETGIESMMDKPATVSKWSGHSGKIVFEGEDWRAQCDTPLSKGDTVIITGYEKMTLTVKKDD